MTKTWFRYLAASLLFAGAGSLPALSANPPLKAATPPIKVTPPKEFGGKMPLPVVQRIERQNKPSDKLLVEVTASAKEGTQYVAYVKVVWGDLDNLIKTTGSQYYSNWDGSLKITGATGAIDEKIQFDDAKAAATPKPPIGPRVGSGRDQVEIPAGPLVEWKAGVVGALDGLRIKITSPTPAIQATLTAGKFTLPLTIAPPLPPPPVAATPALRGTVTRLPPPR